ncbi:MAG: creatininase family protein [Deltaproteobacteria bacterium]
MNDNETTARGYSVFDGTMADMTYVQIEKAAEEKSVVLLPVGVIEEHGPHLPLGVDVYGSYLIAKMVRAELNRKGIGSLIAPPFYWGMNNCTASFAGSFTAREETMINLVWDIMTSLKRWGFENVFIMNHHYDEAQNRALKTALQKARLDTGIRAYWVLDDFLAKRFGFTGKESYLLIHKAPPIPPSQFLEIHADSYETSFMLHYFTDLVDVEAMKSLRPTNVTVQDLKVWRRGWEEARKITPQGFLGDPASASPERGREEIEAYGKRAADLIERFLQGRYESPEMK